MIEWAFMLSYVYLMFNIIQHPFHNKTNAVTEWLLLPCLYNALYLGATVLIFCQHMRGPTLRLIFFYLPALDGMLLHAAGGPHVWGHHHLHGPGLLG